jgi:peptidoglycan hydrolase-like protein with peptidoglycan-binding domain
MKVFCSVLVISLVSAMAVDAKTRTPVSRNGHHNKFVASSSSKKSTVRNTSIGKRTATKGKSGRRTAQSAKRSAPRQSAPTPERYMQIQQALADKGYYSGPINGTWGADSLEALKKFQSDQNLSPDGKLGSLSLIALGLGPNREPVAQFSAKPESNP